MGNIAGKIWGQTELIEANGSCEFHRIDFVKGGTCSKHKHEYKWNGFLRDVRRDENPCVAKGLRPSRRDHT